MPGQKSVQQGDNVSITVQSLKQHIKSSLPPSPSQLFWCLSPVPCKASTPVIIQHDVPSVELRHKASEVNPRNSPKKFAAKVRADSRAGFLNLLPQRNTKVLHPGPQPFHSFTSAFTNQTWGSTPTLSSPSCARCGSVVFTRTSR